MSGKEKIIKAAQELLYEGHKKVSTRKIADKADVSTSLIFHFYKKKDDLLVEAAEAITNDFVEAISSSYKNVVTADEKLRKFLNVYTELVEQSKFFINFLFQRIFLQEKKFMMIAKKVPEANLKNICKIVEEGVKEGIFPNKNTENIIEIIMRFLHSVIFEAAMQIGHDLRDKHCCNEIDLEHSFDFLISLIKK